jgi:hypothetical protein
MFHGMNTWVLLLLLQGYNLDGIIKSSTGGNTDRWDAASTSSDAQVAQQSKHAPMHTSVITQRHVGPIWRLSM